MEDVGTGTLIHSNQHRGLAGLWRKGGYKILQRQDLAPKIHLLKVDAPAVARKAQAGQFVILRIDDTGERIPLTIADWDREEGSVTVVFMEVGKSTMQLATRYAGDTLANFAGPLGQPTEIERYGTVVCVGGGFAVAVIAPVARAMKAAGNHVISIIGARTKERLFWEDRLASVSDELIVTTDDGSAGRQGLVTQPLQELLERGPKVDRVVAIGPSIMMRACAETARPFGVKTIVSLNPIMIDGTGMCGGCRVSVDNETKFACVDGPDFDGHLVDWNLLIARQRVYLEEERRSLELWQCQSSEER